VRKRFLLMKRSPFAETIYQNVKMRGAQYGLKKKDSK